MSVPQYLARQMLGGNRSDFDAIEEAIGYGNEGLVRAVVRDRESAQEQEAEQGTPATELTYIRGCVRGAILNGMRERYGRQRQSRDEHGNRVDIDRIARRKPSVLIGTASSLDKPLGSDAGTGAATLGDMLPSLTAEDELDKMISQIDVDRATSGYSSRDREILFRRVVLEQTLETIADEVGLGNKVAVFRALKRIETDIKPRLVV